ncbi:MAG TPA: SulP family inorganic anion transporter [Candidatus Limenecus avicola]|uniref:SulP family inorganic anion transporter n=1 Tax=Candidatus Limenecus avicola TaxID=2840847 RepID=A0A9D1N0H0_9CLOT|nr:SulP family inorganic anion transporter [Candidatus Limenecus avicola]
MINIDSLKKDFLASVIVFLVAMPLAIGISIACGLPIYCGIISGIIGGIIVGALSGNSLQVSGPAAGLILIVVDIIHTLGIEKLFLIIFVVGLMQILFGFLSLGKWFRAISPAIIQGMLAGIGISIFLSQFHIMLDSKPQNTFIANILDLGRVIYHSVLPMNGSAHHLAAMVGLLTICIIVVWDLLPFKKLKAVPSALVAVIIASLFANFMHFDINYIQVGQNFWSEAIFIKPSLFAHILDLKVLISALVITFIASAETLLTSTAIDKMSSKSKTDYDKEIIAQGVGNALSGVVGGLPITGVIVRSAANINADAQTRMSTILHGLWILLFVSFFPAILNYIPISSLAAILVYTGYKLVDIQAAKHILKLSKGEFAIYIITLVAILFTNLFEGILAGFFCALIKSAYKVLKVDIDTEYDEQTNTITAKIHGNITFIQLPTLIEALERLPKDKNITLCAERLHYIDHACIDFIKEWEKGRRAEITTKGMPYNVHVAWEQMKETYPSFKWCHFHKSHDENDTPSMH